MRAKRDRVLPNFFIVGAPKCGTTSLYNYLQQHPDIFMCEIKEPNYFSCEDIKKQGLYYQDRQVASLEAYSNLFTAARNKKAIGEASVSYLFYPSVPARIKEIIREPKAIILIRHPVERAFSHYLMDMRLGYVTLTLNEIVGKKCSHRNLHLYYQQFVEVGLYYSQIKRYFDVFGRDNVKVCIYDDLQSNMPDVIRSVYSFLGVDEGFEPDTTEIHNRFKSPKYELLKFIYRRASMRKIVKAILPGYMSEYLIRHMFNIEDKPELDNITRNMLNHIFREDILQLEILLGRDLHAWHSGRVR